jgi:hypothetical protein
MQAIKICLSIALFIPTVALSSTNRECLNHLSGGMSDVACYHDLASDTTIKNEKIYRDLLKTIPNKNKNAPLINRYMKHINEGEKYCELGRQAANQWIMTNDTPTMSEHHYYDVIYYRCIYDLKQQQNTYLNMLINLARTGNE